MLNSYSWIVGGRTGRFYAETLRTMRLVHYKHGIPSVALDTAVSVVNSPARGRACLTSH